VVALTDPFASGKAVSMAVAIILALGNGTIFSLEKFIANTFSSGIDTSAVTTAIVETNLLLTGAAPETLVAFTRTVGTHSLTVAIVSAHFIRAIVSRISSIAHTLSSSTCALASTLVGT